MESLFGLPSHPLFVHLPIVIVPLATMGAMGLATWPQSRQRLSNWLAALTGIGLVGTFLATQSGEALNDVGGDRGLADTHERLAGQTLVLVALFFIATVITAIADRFSDGGDGSLRLPATVLSVGSALLGLAASWWMIRTGFEGTSLVWGDETD